MDGLHGDNGDVADNGCDDNGQHGPCSGISLELPRNELIEMGAMLFMLCLPNLCEIGFQI